MINSKIGQASLKCIPSLGGVISALNLFNGEKVVSIIDSYPTIDDEISRLYYKSHYLLPFPNRLMDGKYTFEGKNYQFPINDIANNHNLHGFLDTMKMIILSNQTFDNQNIIQLKGSFDGLEFYPFPFEIYLNYTLTENSLTIDTTIKNTGENNLPIGYGWHPYFRLDTPTVDDLLMQLPSCTKIEIDDKMMPTGKATSFDTFNELSRIGDTQFDNCFALQRPVKRANIILKSATTTLKFWQTTGENDCNYFQLFIPEHRNSIAIEPMTCNVNAFNNQEGLHVLAPNEIFETSFGLELS